VYHHVRDKRALLLELVDRALERALERRADPLHANLLDADPHGGIATWLRASYDRLRKHPTLGLVLLAQSANDPELRMRKERIDALRIERCAAWIALGQRSGRFRRGLDPAGAAFVIHHAVEAAALQLLVHDVRSPDPETVLTELALMLGRYLVEDRSGDELGDR
jgi:AcrR family transcriptional regulator